MTSESTPGQPPARRRMAGYTPLSRPAEPTPEVEAGAAAEAARPAPVEPAGSDQTTTPAAPAPAEAAAPAGEGQAPAADAEPTPAAEPAAEAVTPAPAASAPTGAPARKRRMGGAPAPLATPAPAPAAEQAPASPAAEPIPAAEPEMAPETPAAAAPAPAAPTRKRRMGGAPAPVATPPATTGSGSGTGEAAASAPAAEPDVESTGSAAPAASGSGAGAGAPAPRKKRMGGAPAPADSAAASTAPADSAAATPARKRMGGAPAAAPAAGAPAPGPATAPASGQTSPAAPAAAASAAAPTSGTGSAAPPATASKPTQPATPAASAATTPAGRPAWVKPALIIGGLLVLAALVVLGARWLRTLEGVQEFIATYDGHSTQLEAAPEGMPWWMGWQHFLNMFFIVLIIRTGLQVRTERKPPAYWTATKDSFFSPKGNTPKKVSLSQWLHQSLDVLWVVNGLIFVILLFATGHWMRIVPTDWDVFPNMLSGAIQYASLDWPTENGWVHYNALQVMAYFTTVFIAAPLAIITGLRFSTWWPEKATRLNRAYPVEWARAVHFPVMLYFVGFTIVHVFLVFFTGALRNLNHMYTSRDVVDWWGLVILLVSLAVIAAAWFLTKPMFTTPIANAMGKISK